MSGMKVLSVIVVSFVLGGVVTFYGSGYLGISSAETSSKKEIKQLSNLDNDENIGMHNAVHQVSSAPGMNQPVIDIEEKIIQGIYEKVSPAVVHVTTVTYTYNFWRGELEPRKGTGSGVVVDSRGYILTNFHVIKDALKSRGELYVAFANGDSEEASVIGYDQISDLAVIKLKEDLGESFPVAPLGDSDTLKVGSRAIAIGNPFGLAGTCTVGFISALNRKISIGYEELEGMIQTDATINPGNSGGPLINSSGEVIGINSVIFSQSGGSEGIGFAIPINEAKRIMGDLLAYGKVRRPYLGVEAYWVVPTIANYLKLPVNEGLLIQRVAEDSPAARAGLKGGNVLINFRQLRMYAGGDIILSFNGEEVTRTFDIDKRIRKMEIGDKVNIEIMRDNRKMTVEVELGVKD